MTFLLTGFNILFAIVQFVFYILGIVCMLRYLSGRR